MEIQRHLQIKPDRGDYFGEYFTDHTWDFDWYFGENRIGVTNNPSTEAECFIGGFLVRDDNLIITPSKRSPKIVRASDSYGRMRGGDAGKRNVYDLIELIIGQETTHAFITSAGEEGNNRSVLTFSQITPPRELYKLGKTMPVEIDHHALEFERRMGERLERLARYVETQAR